MPTNVIDIRDHFPRKRRTAPAPTEHEATDMYFIRPERHPGVGWDANGRPIVPPALAWRRARSSGDDAA